ncbi:MAG: VCBS repeat-containing protein [Bacteroidota bacterium]
MRIVFILFALFLLSGCTSEPTGDKLFRLVPSNHSGITFSNEIENTEDFNIFSYRNFYNGGGVSTGDINNDGLADIFFTSNMGQNKLYLNKGNLEFEDITEKAGVGGTKAWSTGVVMIDINHDGWLDIYVCNAGYVKGDDQQNELFINNQDQTFTENAAAYNLNESGYTTHAAFFDYDLDGDLDCYMLNNSFMPVNTLNYDNHRELYAEDWPVKDFLKGGGDKLLRNDNGSFVDVTREAGIYGSLIGFGLGITVGDINEDHLPDLYVSNDFYERDYLYVNQGDGTFNEEIKDWMERLSLASMGADMADINNDGYPEIFVTEMLPSEDYRRKTTTLFEDYQVYLLKQKKDFYHQFMHNTLQLNNKDQSFSEISWYSGVAASDWSWGALMFDADNDGFRDIYICNGVYHDVTDQDFIDFFANDVVQKLALTGEKEDIQDVIDKMPSNPQINKFFKNNGNLTFDDAGYQSGFDQETFSAGAAYADLDNDGDLDLVVNNLMAEAFLFENKADQLTDNHYLRLRLKGSDKNTFAIGAKVNIYSNKQDINFQLIPSRGFQSSIAYDMVFGLGTAASIDSMIITWPDRTRSVFSNPPVDTLLAIDISKVEKVDVNAFPKTREFDPMLMEQASNFHTQEEDTYVDFFQEGLIQKMLSKEGPVAATGDVNGDGKTDLFIGGAAGISASIYLQTEAGFEKLEDSGFANEANLEDTAAKLFDADGDGDLDIFVGAGGNNQPYGALIFQDRLYLNDGTGKFKWSIRGIPKNGFNTSCIVTFDLEGDGDIDLFVGSRSIPNNYGTSPRSYVYENDGKGNFTNVTKTVAPDFETLGMITDAKIVNILGDPSPELVIVGEWMSPKIYSLNDGKFSQVSSNLEEKKGWWYTIESDDVDGDGDMDFILGNRGENFYFSGTKEAPAKLWIYDFDQNQTTEKIATYVVDNKDKPVAMKKELTGQVVSLKKENLRHTAYASKSIQELFPKEILSKATVLEGNYFKSAVALNNGEGQFDVIPLPKEVQFSCVCDIYCTDLNGDGRNDLILGGNDSGFQPQFSKLDASFGHVLLNEANGQFKRIENRESGFFIRGDVKNLLGLQINGEPYIFATINDRAPKLFKINSTDQVQ